MATRTEREEFLGEFFSRSNLIQWDEIKNRTLSRVEDLLPWVERMQQGQLPAALPRVGREESGRLYTDWYVFAGNSRSLRLSRDEVFAFVGPSYGLIDPFSEGLAEDDRIDAAVKEAFPSCFRFRVRPRKGRAYGRCAEDVRSKMVQWLALVENRPVSRATDTVPVGQLLGTFDEQLRLRLLHEARLTLALISAMGVVSSLNTKGLRFLLLDAEGQYDQILTEMSTDILSNRLPKRVVGAVLNAVHHRYLRGVEDPQIAISRFEEEVRPRFGPLLGSSVGLTSPPALELMLLSAIRQNPLDLDQVRSRRDQAVQGGVNEGWANQLADLAVGASAGKDLQDEEALAAAEAYFIKYALDSAWTHALEAEPSPRRLELLIRCLLESESADRMRVVFDLIRAADDRLLSKVPNQLLNRFQERIKDFSADSGDLIPGTWVEWAGLLVKDEAARDAPRLARLAEGQWAWPDEPASDLQTFNQALSSIPDQNRGYLIDSLSTVVDSLARVKTPGPELGSVFGTLIGHIMLDESSRAGTLLSTLRDLAERWLESAMELQDYRDLLDAVDQRVLRDGAAASTDQVLDLFDLLTFYPIVDDARLQASVVQFLQRTEGWIRHLDVVQVELASLLATQFGYPPDRFRNALAEAVSDQGSEEQPWAHLQNRHIALYSLDEAALRRVKEFLADTVEGVTVAAFSSKVSEDRLVNAARECEPFVVVRRSAKHAATDAIRAAYEGVPVYADGKGSASILRALREWRP